MKRIIVTIALVTGVLLLVIGLTGCLQVNLGNLGGFGSVVGNGKVETRDVAVSQALTGVKNMGSFEVTIDPTLAGKAVLEGESNILDLVNASQDTAGVFTVSFKDNISISTTHDVKVRVPVVNGGALEVSGSGEILLDTGAVLEGKRFDLEVNGSGTINVALQSSFVAGSINGSGDIKATGTTEGLKIGIFGSGNFDGFDLASSSAEVSINGSGDANVAVSQSLTGSVNGSGNITYAGDPPTVNVGGHGSGDVHKR